MKRYEGALRRLSILFILINLLSPLSAATTTAQDQTTDTTTQTTVGTLRIILEGSNGNIPGGAFWVGGTYAADGGQNDADGVSDSVTTVANLPAGDYVVTQDATGSGYVASTITFTGSVPAGGVGDLRVWNDLVPPPDTDGDGIIDANDSCPVNTNLGTNWNGDGVDDACDSIPDSDSDGLLDNVDSCPAVPNIGTDWNSDGVDDACDPMPDRDADGIADSADNCPDVANPNQEDTDEDGIGDACQKVDEPNEPEPPALTEFAPVDPTEELAVCTDGTLSTPSLTFNGPEGVTYTIDPAATDEAPYTVGQTVTITASLDDAEASAWDDEFASDVWTLNTETNTYSRSFTFTDVECEKPEGKPALTLVKTATALNGEPVKDFTIAQPDDVITFTIVATNSGEVDLTNVVITDDLRGISELKCDLAAPVTLKPGESLQCTATYTLSEDEVSAGSLMNTANASSEETKAEPATVTVTLCTDCSLAGESEGPMPAGGGMMRMAAIDYTDAPDSAFADVVVDYSPVYWPSGDTRDCRSALNNNDPSQILGRPEGSFDTTVSLAGGSIIIQFTDNRLVPDGTSAGDLLILERGSFAEATEIYISNNLSSDWIYVGTLSDESNADSQAFDIDSLVPANSEFQYVMLVDNINRAGGCGTTGRNMDGPDIDGVWAISSADITLEKTANPTTYVSLNEEITYTFTVTNAGKVTLNNVEVTDPLPGLSTITCLATTLAPGASTTCSATYNITATDLTVPSVTNTATVTGETAYGSEVSDKDDATITNVGKPALSITKTAINDDGPYALGEIVEYEIEVQNEGNTTLTGVTIDDPDATIGTCTWPGAAGTLLVGQSATCPATYQITELDIANGSFTNIATADSDQTGEETATETVDTVAPTTTLTLTKSASPDSVTSAPTTVTYTFVVKNTGNQTLTGVTITDTFTTATENDLVWVSHANGLVGTLTPGQEVTATATLLVTQADLNAGLDIVNTAIATDDGDVESNEPEETVDLVPNPAMTFSKTTDVSSYDAVGDVITYRFEVENTGNVTLDNVTVVDTLAGLTALSCAVETSGGASEIVFAQGDSLAPGDRVICSATYTIDQDDLDNGEVVNAATADSDDTDPIDDDVTVTATQSPDISLTKTAIEVNDTDVTTSPVAGLEVDDVVTYEFVATNEGNVTLTNVSIEELSPNMLGLTFDCDATTPATLAPGESLTCTADYTVTQPDYDAQVGIYNLAEASGTAPEGAQPSTVYDQDDETVYPNIAGPAIDLDKTATQVNGEDVAGAVTGLLVDDVVTYTFVVTNVGDVTLTNIAVAELTPDMIGLTLNCEAVPVGGLAPNGQIECTADYTIDQDDVNNGSVYNNAQVTADYNNEPITPATDDETVTTDSTATIQIDKSADVTSDLNVGDDVVYTYRVENTGKVTLTNVMVTDDKIADDSTIVCEGSTNNVIASMAPGDVVSCSVTVEITQAMVNTYGPTGTETTWSITNIGTASATDPQDNDVTDTDDETVSGPRNVSIDMSKEVTKVVRPGDIPVTFPYGPTDPVVNLQAGDVVTYTLIATNDGDVTLTNVVVTDPMFPALSCTVDSLAPGAWITCAVDYTVTQDDVDAQAEIPNTATATAYDPQQNEVTESDDEVIDVITARLDVNLTKTATKVNDDDVTGPVTGLMRDDVVTYTFVATNNSNVTLDAMAVDEVSPDMLGLVLNCEAVPAAGLAPGESITCTAEYTIDQDDVDAGSVHNVAKATGTFGEDTATDTDDETVTTAQNPAMTFSKTTDVSSYDAVGDVITYRFEVENTGNVTLDNVTVVDTLAGLTALSCAVETSGGASEIVFAQGDSLAPGDRVICSATYTIDQDDLDAGEVVNAATADSDQTDPIDDDVIVPADQKPALELIKESSPAQITAADQVITYTFTVKNTGNVTLENIVINDALTGIEWSEGSEGGVVGTLAPNASKVLTATYTVSQEEIDLGEDIHNSAIATGELPNCEEDCDVDSPPDETDTPIVQKPGITIDKSADTGDVETVTAGTVITYTFTVKNTGNVTLDDVKITDELPGLVWSESYPNGEIGTMDPGETVVVTATYEVTDADVEAGKVYNQAIVTGDAPGEEDPSDEDENTVPVAQNPMLAISKVCPDPATVGRVNSMVSYEVTITNAGDVTIYEIAVTDMRDGTFDPAFPTELAPGEEFTSTFTTEILANDAENGNLDNTVRVDGIAMLEPVADDDSDIPVVFFAAQNDDDDNGDNGDKVRTDVSAEVTIECVYDAERGLHIEKVADAVDEDDVTAGTVITYSFEVTNTGDTTLNDIMIVDELEGLVWDEGFEDGMVGTLAPGASVTATATYVVTDADVEAGHVLNCAIATDGENESNESCVDVPVDQNPALTIMKTATPHKVTKAGEVITYTFVVTNTGGVTLHDVVVVDEMLDAAGVEIPAIGTLAPGETKMVTAKYTVTDEDMKLKKIVNSAIATDGTTESEPDTATVKVHHPKPAPEPTPEPTPAPVSKLPSTGSGTGDQFGLWIYAATGAAIMAAGALGLRTQKQR